METLYTLFKKIDSKLLSLDIDLQKILQFHKKIVNFTDKRIAENYGVYLDNIIFRKKLFDQEITTIKNFKNIINRNLYGEIYKINKKCIKLYTMLEDYNDIQNIKIYNPFNNEIYSLDELKLLINETESKINLIDRKLNNFNTIIKNTSSNSNSNSISNRIKNSNEININPEIIDTKEKILEISLTGEYSKFMAEINNIKKLYLFMKCEHLLKFEKLSDRIDILNNEVIISLNELETYFENITISDMDKE